MFVNRVSSNLEVEACIDPYKIWLLVGSIIGYSTCTEYELLTGRITRSLYPSIWCGIEIGRIILDSAVKPSLLIFMPFVCSCHHKLGVNEIERACVWPHKLNSRVTSQIELSCDLTNRTLVWPHKSSSRVTSQIELSCDLTDRTLVWPHKSNSRVTSMQIAAIIMWSKQITNIACIQ